MADGHTSPTYGAHELAMRQHVLARWVNHTVDGRCKHVNDWSKDFQDGVVFIHLVTIITQRDIVNDPHKPVSIRPRSKRENAQNITAILDIVAKRGLQTDITEHELVNGDIPKTLEFVYLLALVHYGGFSITKEKMRNLTIQRTRNLLRENKHDPNVKVANTLEIFNVSTNFADGSLFLVMIEGVKPDLFNLESCLKKSPQERLKLAFQLCKQEFGVPNIIEVDEMLKVHDEVSVTLFMTIFYDHAKRGYGEGDSQYLKDQRLRFEEELEMRYKKKFDENFEIVKREFMASETKRADETIKSERVIFILEAETKDQIILEAKEKFDRLAAENKRSQDDLAKALERGQANTELIDKLMAKLQYMEDEKNRGPASNGVEAPTGLLCLMFTDVQGSTNQWELFPDVMSEALKIHNKCIREILPEYGGYEVKTEGDAFMVAFASGLKAVRCAMHIQRQLLKEEWPDRLFENNANASIEQDSKGQMIWRGLRVRIGIHQGTPLYAEDPTTHRMDYFGPVVNKSARIEAFGAGGQIVVSHDLGNSVAKLIKDAAILDLGHVPLKGIGELTGLMQITPVELKERKFVKKEDKEKEKEFDPEDAMKMELRKAKMENEQLTRQLASVSSKQKLFSQDVASLQTRLDSNGKVNADAAELDKVAETIKNVVKEAQELKSQLDQTKLSQTAMEEQIKDLQMQLQKATGEDGVGFGGGSGFTRARGRMGSRVDDEVTVELRRCIATQQQQITELHQQLDATKALLASAQKLMEGRRPLSFKEKAALKVEEEEKELDRKRKAAAKKEVPWIPLKPLDYKMPDVDKVQSKLTDFIQTRPSRSKSAAAKIDRRSLAERDDKEALEAALFGNGPSVLMFAEEELGQPRGSRRKSRSGHSSEGDSPVRRRSDGKSLGVPHQDLASSDEGSRAVTPAERRPNGRTSPPRSKPTTPALSVTRSRSAAASMNRSRVEDSPPAAGGSRASKSPMRSKRVTIETEPSRLSLDVGPPRFPPLEDSRMSLVSIMGDSTGPGSYATPDLEAALEAERLRAQSTTVIRRVKQKAKPLKYRGIVKMEKEVVNKIMERVERNGWQRPMSIPDLDDLIMRDREEAFAFGVARPTTAAGASGGAASRPESRQRISDNGSVTPPDY